jgi:NADH-quinone oxidoreductase subunit H
MDFTHVLWPVIWFIVIYLIPMNVVLLLCAYLILIERKVAAYAQDRLGPNRVGPWGLLQPIADGVKFLLKEDIIPDHVDRVFYLVAPGVAVATSLFALVVVPYGPTSAAPQRPWPETVAQAEAQEQADHAPGPAGGESFADMLERYNQTYQFVIAPRVDIGFLLVFAVGSLAVYGIILGGWSSASKYSFLGALRSSAQIISYEIPMGLSVLGVVLMAGSLNLERIIDRQVYVTGWNVVYQPLAFVMFLTAILAECNRLPFDLPEAEQELVGGYHTEYSSMKFALFFLGEYAHMIVTSYLLVTIFLGGWQIPLIAGPGTPVAWRVIVFFLKMFAVIVLEMFIRWTIPRFRFDQLMSLTWKVFIPLALLNVLGVMVVQQFQLSPWWLLPWSIVLLAAAGAWGLYRPREPRQSLVVYRGHEYVELTR